MSQSQTANDAAEVIGNIQYLNISTSIGDNDILYSSYLDAQESKTEENDENVNDDLNYVIYFGGDVQDFKESMIERYTFNEYGHFCLESILKMLQIKFPKSSIMIIRPCKMNGHISIFSNFIANVDTYGQSVPSYKNGNGCKHLLEILSQLTANNKNKQMRLHLIGFSRGCNVLNQLIYETAEQNVKNKQIANSLFCHVHSIYFLDGGNGGKRKTLPVDSNVIQNFIQNVIKVNGFRFHIYGTSYQWMDAERPWIGKEQQYFTSFIKQSLLSKLQKKSYFLHHHLYSDEQLDASLIQNNVKAFKLSKNKGIFRHFELLRLFNVSHAKYLL